MTPGERKKAREKFAIICQVNDEFNFFMNFQANLKHKNRINDQREKSFVRWDKLRNSLIKFYRSLSIQGYDRL